ncbi:MAG TPA: thioredoxin family protein, partial [Chloroflexia bacterium]|nr:thioredoxin family protein [Chloroflexia bacterium]
MSITAERFTQGMTFNEYVAQMAENQEKFAANYAGFQITPGDQEVICGLGQPLNVLIITEDWCGDALTYVPVLGRLAECAGTWNLRVFLRDQNLDLADQYLNQGKWRSVPVVVFFDQEMRELGRFIERPALANQDRQGVIDSAAAEHPEV